MKKPLLFFSTLFLLFSSLQSSSQVVAGRMNEVFLKTDLVNAAQNFDDPWEITYGPDDSLWVTEAKGYKVRKVSPLNGGYRTILDLTTFTDAASTPTTKWRKAYTPGGSTPNPQGGLMGLALEPNFNTSANKYVYLAYVHDYIGQDQTYHGEQIIGYLFITWVTRWQYLNGMLRNPVSICDTLHGSSDHNSGRMIIAPEPGGTTNYLYYAIGDMGAGQFENTGRYNKAQVVGVNEGKILRFNLDNVATGSWVPGDNPFGNAVYALGIRNNQGFAYDSVYGTPRLYGTSHGPFSDDEFNLLEKGMNYGHPIVIGKASDGNYNNAKAGTPASVLPLIGTESANAASIGVTYRDPLYVNYAAPATPATTPWTVQYIYTNKYYNPAGPGTEGNAQDLNGFWASEGYSGAGLYVNNKIPGWRNSIMMGCLKWGRVLRMKLNNDGSAVIASGATDTVSYFGSINRFRDIAIDSNGRDIYVVMDRSTSSSGPSASNPIVPACAGCVQKYTFLGYNNNGGASMIPNFINVARGSVNTCKNANRVTVNANNNTIWVPVTDDSSNIVAEIRANSNNLGNVHTSFFYKNSGTVRQDGAKKLYMDRNISITVQNLPASNIFVRLYITNGELTRMINATNTSGIGSGVTAIGNIAIFSTTSNCSVAMNASATKYTTSNAVQAGSQTPGYVLTASIPPAAFGAVNHTATFFFANNALTTLPTELISFTGILNTDRTVGLNWKTGSEINLSNYVVERSIDGRNYQPIGTVAPNGKNDYDLTDKDAYSQASLLIYYRLKIVDIDQSYKYSNVITISLADLVGTVIATPNPTSGISKVSMTAAIDGNANWKVIDNAGRTVIQSNILLRTGANSMTLDLSKLASGIYYLNVTGVGIDSRIKLQKL